MPTPIEQLVDESTFDASGRPGLTYRRITGARVALEWCVRRWLAPRDGLPWALGTCIDLFAYRDAAFRRSELARIKAGLDAEGARSEYVVSIESTLELTAAERMRFAPRITLARSGTYPLVLDLAVAGDVLVQFPIL